MRCTAGHFQAVDWAVRVAAMLLLSAPASIHAQDGPVIRTGTELSDPGPLSLGMAVGAVLVSGEAFDFVGTGPSLHVFAALPLQPFEEMRVGFTYSRHADDLAEDDVVVKMVWAEPQWGTGLPGNLRLRYGLRAAYVHEERSIFTKTMHGIGGGAIAGLHRSLGSRATIEASVLITGLLLPAADIAGSPDPDGRSNAWFREFRIGLSVRPW